MYLKLKKCVNEFLGLGTLVRVVTDKPVVALTFDDGPSPDYTPTLLRILEEHGALATFFVVGEKAARYPQLIQEMVSRGHCVGNHSWDHPSFPTLSGLERRRQMKQCAEILPRQDPLLFRPPFGHQTVMSRLDARRMGYEVVTWTAMAGDWQDHSAARLLRNLEEKIRPGNIILLHDALFSTQNSAFLDRTATLQAVQELLETYSDYEFVTVPRLLRMGRPVRVPWYRQGDRAWLDSLKTEDALTGSGSDPAATAAENLAD